MTKLRMFKGMTQNERIIALEAVMDEKLHLFVLIPKTGNYVVPKGVMWSDVEVDMEKYLCEGGFLEFKDGNAAACNVFAGVGRIGATLLDEEGVELDYVHYHYSSRFEVYRYSREKFSINNDLLAVDDLLPEEKMKQFSIPTPEFAAIHAVYGKYWASGKGGQTKDNIVAWIRTEFGFSKKTAEVIDTICRPEDRRIGGNVKLKRV